MAAGEALPHVLVLSPGHPSPAELPWVPPAHPGLVVNAESICCHRSWPSQAQRPRGHLSSCLRQAADVERREILVSLSVLGCLCSKLECSGVIIQILGAGSSRWELHQGWRCPRAGGTGSIFSCVTCGHSDIPPQEPFAVPRLRAPRGLTPVPTPSTGDVSPVPFVALCSLPPAPAEGSELVLALPGDLGCHSIPWSHLPSLPAAPSPSSSSRPGA